MALDWTYGGSRTSDPGSGGAGAQAGRRVVRELGPDGTRTFRRLADREGAAPETVLTALWALLLTQYTGDTDVTFGVTGGTVRVTVDLDRPFTVLLRAVEAGPAGTAANGDGDGDGDGHDTTLIIGPGAAPRAAVTVSADLGTGRLVAEGDHPGLPQATAERLLRHLGQLLQHVAGAAPDTPLAAVSCLSPAELALIVDSWNETSGPSPEGSIVDLLTAQARLRPDAVAVAGPDRQLTYAQLMTDAERVAAHLAGWGAGRGALVPIAVSRTVDAVVAVVGVLLAGAAFVPIEDSWPDTRVRRVLDQLDAPVLITDAHRIARVAPVAAGQERPPALLHLGATPETAAAGLELVEAATAPRPPARGTRDTPGPDDLAYVLFTSGSTGTPKGVAVEHRPVVNLLGWTGDTFATGPDDRVLLVTPLGFDLSVFSVLGPLATGGSVRVATEEELADPARILTILSTEPVTVWNSAPAALAQLEPYLPGGALTGARLRLVLLSGDWIPVAQPGTVRAAFPGAEVVALGGPTETTVWSNYFRIGEVDPGWTSIPYGWPIRNVRRYVLDARLRPVPVGVPGRLFVGGDCLAREFLGDPELTGLRFRPDPFAGPGSRMYDTGDRVRLWDDGTMEFLGRGDDQVKIRGYRIELGEVEAALQGLPQVERAVAAVRELPGGPAIVGYVVPAGGAVPSPAAIRSAAGELLPEYMVPTVVVPVDRLPLTPNGKVDRRALPVPPAADAAPAPAVPEPAASRGRAATAAADVWKRVLAVPEIRDEDSFAGLGGHSIAAAQATARLSKLLQAPIPIRTILTTATFADYVARVESVVATHSAS